jgi:hypothetical protein
MYSADLLISAKDLLHIVHQLEDARIPYRVEDKLSLLFCLEYAIFAHESEKLRELRLADAA